MYQVLLVDDEINILEGIAALVDWSACGAQLRNKATNGLMAYELIKSEPPDIVITDIKMPGMNGVELIKKVHVVYPSIKFIILSGYDEFDFAKSAMAHNVKHYLLKPTNENKIEEALNQVIAELEEKKEKEGFLESMRTKLQRIMPEAKAQFFKEYISNKKYGMKEWQDYEQLLSLNYSSEQFRLVVSLIDGEHEYEQLFALKEMMAKGFEEAQNVLLITLIENKVVLLLEATPAEDAAKVLRELKEPFSYYYKLTFTTAISHSGTVRQLRTLYRESLQCLTYRFYLGNGSLMITSEIEAVSGDLGELQFDHEELMFLIRSGNVDEVRRYISEYFSIILKRKYSVTIVKSHCLELYMSIIRQTKNEWIDSVFQQMESFQELTTLESIREFIERVSIRITEENYEKAKETHSTTVHRVIDYMEHHIADHTLSLAKMSNDVFYMNSDYLGKLFKKEVGEKFSAYLVNLRIEKAKELIKNSGDVKVIDIAGEVGFGNNPRYFSQVFKKHTGYTPSEYKDSVS